ncbi:hypothetical protein V3C99_005876 [Haemonchus contortus]
MLSYFMCALLLLNAFTTKAEETEECKDELDSQTCYEMYEGGSCELVSDVCAKTCHACDASTTKAEETEECKDELDSQTCYEMYEGGSCELVSDVCAKTCHAC